MQNISFCYCLVVGSYELLYFNNKIVNFFVRLVAK